MTDEYATDRRVALDMGRMLSALDAPAEWLGTNYSLRTTSTQRDAQSLLGEGARVPFVVCADEQTHGRGRLDRTWSAPAFSSILMTVVLERPARLSTVPLQAGLAVAKVLRSHGVAAALKWPNDIIVERDGVTRKLGGIISELQGDAVLIGIGVNILLADQELPTPVAISLLQLGISAEREVLIAGIASEVRRAVTRNGSLDDYRAACATIGATVTVSMADGSRHTGRAIGVDDDGALVVRVDGVDVRVTAGDVEHVRPGGAA